MRQVKFSTNWNNKLDCRCFTTIRLKNPSKHKLNEVYAILLKNSVHKKAEIVSIRTIYYSQINEYIARLDTGYPEAEAKGIIKRMYPNVDLKTKPFSFILFQTIK